MISQRQSKILNCLIEEYIASAQPVSSRLLEKKHDFDLCPASIRIEMQKLTDGGYLFQPHTSAGRVPTDKGYRFFVDSLLTQGASQPIELEELKKILQTQKDVFRLASELTKSLADFSSNFVISCLSDNGFFAKEGWDEVLAAPEFDDKLTALNFARLLEEFEKEFKNFKVNSEMKVFIGKENPLKQAKEFSMIITRVDFPQKKKGIISIVGPKRMAYQKNIGLINSLKEILAKI